MIPKFTIAVLLDDQARLELHITSDLPIANAHIDAPERAMVQFIESAVINNKYRVIFIMPQDTVFIASIGTLHIILFNVCNIVRCAFSSVIGDFCFISHDKDNMAVDAFLSRAEKGIEHGFAVLQVGQIAEVQLGGY